VTHASPCVHYTGVLLPSERTWLLAQPHKPLAVGQALSAILQATDLDTQTKSSLDKTITTFTYEFGACNRIYNTAIPAAYTRWVS
jgi:predicted membrane chloride channel (bestrophin family)